MSRPRNLGRAPYCPWPLTESKLLGRHSENYQRITKLFVVFMHFLFLFHQFRRHRHRHGRKKRKRKILVHDLDDQSVKVCAFFALCSLYTRNGVAARNHWFGKQSQIKESFNGRYSKEILGCHCALYAVLEWQKAFSKMTVFRRECQLCAKIRTGDLHSSRAH